MMTKTTTARMIAIMISAYSSAFASFSPLINCLYSDWKSLGIRETILINRTIEIPLPMPFSVIRSPIHIRKAEPAVSTRMTIRQFRKLYLISNPCLPKPIAIADDSRSESPTVI